MYSIDKALQPKNGIVKATSKCIACGKEFEWYVVVGKEKKEVHGLQKAEMILEEGCIQEGRHLYADASIYAECSHCGIKSKFNCIKIMLK